MIGLPDKLHPKLPAGARKAASALSLGLRRCLRSIRARIVLLALIVLVPFAMDRVQLLNDFRGHQIENIRDDAINLARQSALRQTEAVANTEAFLHATVRLYEEVIRNGGSCDAFKSKITLATWTKTIAVADTNGKIVCSTEPRVHGINVSDRSYFNQALTGGGFALSDYIIARGTEHPVVVAAHAARTNGRTTDAVVLMSVNLQWLANLRSTVDQNTFASTFVIDRDGVMIAGSEDVRARIGDNLAAHTLVGTMLAKNEGTLVTSDFNGTRRIFAFSRIPDSQARLAVGIDERKALGAIDRSISLAYFQFFLIGMAVVIGAWVACEIMVMRPIRAFAGTAARLGKGDLTARVSPSKLATEFGPLAKAFNDMATQLAGRESGLVADNNRLTVLASVDAVSGLGNRRGFDSRLDFEWMRMASDGRWLGMLMIDLDHFKQFNDSYGHPEGDSCLRAIGAVLSEIADAEAGFAARYGGEEFVLLVPGADLERMTDIGERVRRRVLGLALPHNASPFDRVTVSVGASATRPDPAMPAELLVESSDAGLYAAKRRGRNQVVAHAIIAPLARPDAAGGEAPPDPAKMAQ